MFGFFVYERFLCFFCAAAAAAAIADVELEMPIAVDGFMDGSCRSGGFVPNSRCTNSIRGKSFL